MAHCVQLTNAECAEICRFYLQGEGLTGKALSVERKKRDVTLTDELVTNKAKQLYNTMPHDDEGGKEFKFSHGWLGGFRKQYGLFYRLEPSRSLATKKMSGHKVVSVQSQVRLTRIEFFPPKIIAVYQPMECGILYGRSRLTTGST
ncbi:hypothetical protein R1sor_017251 [Riccia sorocarpa]|uniref:HTH CENPB-type domain-containing protein n=1 Tax=Riccia sorocarpa TaxID=122646 RepID=A0ABD3ICH5_9MARC